jgi:hypothetical protein
MTMDHADYVELKNQLQSEFDGRYVLIADCEINKQNEATKIDGLKDEFSRLREEVRVDRAKTNTRLNILIAILSTLAVPIVGVCVKLLFG